MPLSGIWKVSFSLQSKMVDHKENIVWVYVNEKAVTESLHKSYFSNSHNSGEVTYTGGREIILDVDEGDTISLRTTTMQGNFWEILMCLEYQPV